MTKSPYSDISVEEWLNKTQELVKKHPLDKDEIFDIVLISWERLWKTNIGDYPVIFPIEEINPPATVIGYIFEKLFALELANRYPNKWRNGNSGNEKDIKCITNDEFSFEIKTSGQIGTKIFGNRSYGQKNNSEKLKKNKSGYYLTVNFYKKFLNLVRFGWIDYEDWISQKSPTGQMAGLSQDVYKYKLIPICKEKLNPYIGTYKGLGKKVIIELEKYKIYTINDFINFESSKLPEKLKILKNKIIANYQNNFDLM